MMFVCLAPMHTDQPGLADGERQRGKDGGPA